MPDVLTITVEDAVSQGKVPETIIALLEAANTEFNYPNNPKEFCASLRESDGQVAGGIKVQARFDWLYISTLVVVPQWRGRRYGRELLALAEDWGRQQGCHDVWLSTLSVNARRFYEREGYSVFAELAKYPEHQTRFFMRKSL